MRNGVTVLARWMKGARKGNTPWTSAASTRPPRPVFSYYDWSRGSVRRWVERRSPLQVVIGSADQRMTPDSPPIQFYREDMGDGTDALVSNQVAREVYDVLRHGRDIEMHYQPIIDIATGEIEYFEALARIRHGEELLMPGSFLPVIEARRLELEFDAVVLDAIVAAIGGRSFEITFPKRFTYVLKVLRMLPYALYFPLIRRMTGQG